MRRAREALLAPGVEEDREARIERERQQIEMLLDVMLISAASGSFDDDTLNRILTGAALGAASGAARELEELRRELSDRAVFLCVRPADTTIMTSYASLWNNRMEFMARLGDLEAFEQAAAIWQEVDWPQRDVDRAWREKRIDTLRDVAESPP